MTQTNKISKKVILIVVTIILIGMIATAFVVSKNTSPTFKSSKDAKTATNTQQTASNQNNKLNNQIPIANQQKPLSNDEQYIDSLLKSKSDAARYEELLK